MAILSFAILGFKNAAKCKDRQPPKNTLHLLRERDSNSNDQKKVHNANCPIRGPKGAECELNDKKDGNEKDYPDSFCCNDTDSH